MVQNSILKSIDTHKSAGKASKVLQSVAYRLILVARIIFF
jgi:hypothetical protein